MDVWEPLNSVCTPGGASAKLMEGQGTVSTALNTLPLSPCLFLGAVKPQLTGHSSISSCVAVLGLSPPLVPCHIMGCSPAPGTAGSGSVKGSRAGRKGSITVTNNCVLTN